MNPLYNVREEEFDFPFEDFFLIANILKFLFFVVVGKKKKN